MVTPESESWSSIFCLIQRPVSTRLVYITELVFNLNRNSSYIIPARPILLGIPLMVDTSHSTKLSTDIILLLASTPFQTLPRNFALLIPPSALTSITRLGCGLAFRHWWESCPAPTLRRRYDTIRYDPLRAVQSQSSRRKQNRRTKSASARRILTKVTYDTATYTAALKKGPKKRSFIHANNSELMS